MTGDGRPMGEVLSYARRGSRLTPKQSVSWERYADAWWIPDQAVDVPGFSLLTCFERSAPLVMEIGSGIGESTAALAAAYPAVNVVACEVWRPGIADTLTRIAQAGLTNVRTIGVDAAWSLEYLVGSGELAGLWTFFPDPWHKKRHHKRRLVSPRFARIAATKLTPGSQWRLATDCGDYATHIKHVLDTESLLIGGVVDRWDKRPVTKFERKGLAAQRLIVDFSYTRV
jgi:tRNA (guanine-N7-)-methyltransferase